MQQEAFRFQVWFSDGSLYQGRVYAESLKQALATILAELPAFPGDPEPVRLQVDMKGA